MSARTSCTPTTLAHSMSLAQTALVCQDEATSKKAKKRAREEEQIQKKRGGEENTRGDRKSKMQSTDNLPTIANIQPQHPTAISSKRTQTQAHRDTDTDTHTDTNLLRAPQKPL